MKNVFNVGILSYILALSASGLAATTGTLLLSATVPSATAIVVTPVGSPGALDPTVTATDFLVANVREINNTTAGYHVTLSSANAGVLKNGTLGTIPYTAKYNGSSVVLSVTPQNITIGAPSTSVVNRLKTFSISYTGLPNDQRMAGTYNDTLTFTITSP